MTFPRCMRATLRKSPSTGATLKPSLSRRSDDRARSIVVELNPRLRAKHPGWTPQTLEALARQKAQVRITGWVMLDPEHPDQVGETRGTIWEVHPVTKIETDQGGGQWRVVQ